MTIQVLFFGAAASLIGERCMERSFAYGATSRSVFDQIKAEYPSLGRHKLIFSVNQTYASGDEVVHDGDEIAIFTAVSGG